MAEDSMETDSDLVVAAVPEGQGKLVCIQYPGFVDNVDRALSSLGGMKTIEKVYHEKNHVLEAWLRPEDRYCKPVVGRPLPVTNLVLRVRRRKEGSRGEEGGASEGSTARSDCQVEVLGMVNQTYEFRGMADFQVLPPGLNQVSHRADTLDPRIFQLTEPLDDTFEGANVPLFLPPWTFSKFDKPSNYAARPDFQHRVTGNQVAGSSRQRRQVFAIGIPFDHKGPVPSKAHPDVPDVPTASQPKLEVIKKLFEERLIWSRGGIQHRTQLPPVTVRSMLAVVSYYFTSGPWKLFWVKLGYDPRSSPDSKQYQCFDYRLPREIAVVSSLESRRRKLKTANVQGEKRKFQLAGDHQESVEFSGKEAEPDSSLVFAADRLPPQRQLYYQLCDLRDDSLQAIIHSNDGREEKCSETNGWCEDGAYDQLRKVLGEIVRRTAERVHAEHQMAQQNVPTSTSQGRD